MKTGKWSEEEYNYVRNNYINKTSAEIGISLNRNPRSVSCMAYWLGLRKGWGKPRCRTYSINKNMFKNWTSISAYLIGLIITDGNLTDRMFRIAIKDIELLEKVKTVLNSEHPITHVKNKDLYLIQIGHKEMVNDLKSIGITENKSKTCVLPAVPDEFFFDFLRGYIDGDGGIYNRFKRGLTIKITTGSPFIFDDISNTISRLLNIDKMTPISRTGFKGQTQCKWFTLSYYGAYASLICESIYAHCDNLYLSRKRQNYIDYLNRPLDWRCNGNATKHHIKQAQQLLKV